MDMLQKGRAVERARQRQVSALFVAPASLPVFVANARAYRRSAARHCERSEAIQIK